MYNLINTIINGDCLVESPKIPDKSIDLNICDPPYNLNYKYDKYKDNKSKQQYLDFSAKYLKEIYRTLKDNGTFWLICWDNFVSELDILCKDIGFIRRNWCIWHYTFGQNTQTNFIPSKTHLLYYVKSDKFTFNSDQIRIPSKRQLIYKDKRANPKGKLPDNVWEFPRICGTFKEKVDISTQLPLQLVSRIVSSCSNENDLTADFMCGSGTVLISAKQLKRNYFGIELSENYFKICKERL